MNTLASAVSPAPLTAQELLDRFADDCSLRRMTPETIRSYVSNLRTIAVFLEGRNRSFLDLASDDLKAILSFALHDRGVRPKLHRSEVNRLRSSSKPW